MDEFLSPKARLGTDIKLSGKDLHKRATGTGLKIQRNIPGNCWSISHPRQPDLQLVELPPPVFTAVSANTRWLFLETLSHPPSLERNSCCPCPSEEVSFQELYLSQEYHTVLWEVALCFDPQETCPERCHSVGQQKCLCLESCRIRLKKQTPGRCRKIPSSPQKS